MKFLFALSIRRVHTRSLEWRRGVALLGHLRHSQRVKPLFRLYALCTNEYAQHSFQKGMYRGWDFLFVGSNTSNDNKMIMRVGFDWKGALEISKIVTSTKFHFPFHGSRLSFLACFLVSMKLTDSERLTLWNFLTTKFTVLDVSKLDESDLRSFPFIAKLITRQC